MRNRRELEQLAEQHGIDLKKRVWFDRRDENGKRETHFLDVPRPPRELEADLIAKGVLS